MQNKNSRRITGSSILMLVDNLTNSFEMKIIDLSSVYYFEDLRERDEGYIKGIQNLLNMLSKL